MRPKYKILEHTADLKIQANGSDLAELFSNMALGMMTYKYQGTSNKVQITKENVRLKAQDVESLLVDWLSELLYLSDTNNLAYTKFDFKKISETELEAKVYGFKAEAKDDIKAVTYHQLEVKKTDEGWQAIVIFDI